MGELCDAGREHGQVESDSSEDDDEEEPVKVACVGEGRKDRDMHRLAVPSTK